MNLDPYGLQKHARKFHSMHGEDGITLALCNKIQPPRSFVEIGCANGVGPLENNCIVLARMNWDGWWIDRDSDGVQRLADAYPPHTEGLPDTNRQYIGATITAENARLLAGAPNPLGVLSLDIDGNDYWVWKALPLKPAIAIIECNTQKPLDEPFVMSYDPEYVWDHRSQEIGASLYSMTELAHTLGYAFVCTASPTPHLDSPNAFYVRADLLDLVAPRGQHHNADLIG